MVRGHFAVVRRMAGRPVLWRHRRTGIGHRRRRHRRGSHWRRRCRWPRAVRRQSRSSRVRARRAHGIATGRILRPNGRRQRERGDHRYTVQKMMFHVYDPLSRSSVGHGRHDRTITTAAVLVEVISSMLQMVFATVSWSSSAIIGYRDPWNWVPSGESQGGREAAPAVLGDRDCRTLFCSSAHHCGPVRR